MRTICFFKSMWIFLLIVILNVSCTKDEVELTGEIYGRITNGFSGEPLSGVSVTITPGGRSTFTGRGGTLFFLLLNVSLDNIICRHSVQVSKLIINKFQLLQVKGLLVIWCLIPLRQLQACQYHLQS